MATMIKCADKATFQYLMDYYQLSKIPIFYKGVFRGYVTRDMQYIKGSIYFVNISDAFLYAFAIFVYKTVYAVNFIIILHTDYANRRYVIPD